MISSESPFLDVKRKPSSPSHGAAAPARARVVDTRPSESREFQPKTPVITGEVNFKGTVGVDGSLSGQIGSGSSLIVKQRPSSSFASHPEINGEITFRDMVRINGHVAGSIYSKTGTLIVDVNATIDAHVDVAAAVIGGTVRGDIVARERVELGPASKIYGNIWTRSLVIKDGAIFEGVCRMIEEQQKAS